MVLARMLTLLGREKRLQQTKAQEDDLLKQVVQPNSAVAWKPPQPSHPPPAGIQEQYRVEQDRSVRGLYANAVFWSSCPILSHVQGPPSLMRNTQSEVREAGLCWEEPSRFFQHLLEWIPCAWDLADDRCPPRDFPRRAFPAPPGVDRSGSSVPGSNTS